MRKEEGAEVASEDKILSFFPSMLQAGILCDIIRTVSLSLFRFAKETSSKNETQKEED